MTLIRRLARGISDRAVRRSRPGCKEWAEGLSRELDSIPSDWHALAWSLGSWRVLFCKPPKSLLTPAEIARAGRIYAGNREYVPPMVALMMLLQALTWGLRAAWPIHHMGGLERLGAAVSTLSAVYLAVVGWIETRMVPRPDDMDDSRWIDFYHSEMVRLRDLYSGVGASFRVAVVVLLAGSTLSIDGPARHYLTWFLLLGGIFLAWQTPKTGEVYQQKINALDSVMRQNGAGQ